MCVCVCVCVCVGGGGGAFDSLKEEVLFTGIIFDWELAVTMATGFSKMCDPILVPLLKR